MKRREILNKLLIKPKKLILKDGVHKRNENACVYTNADETDFSFLLKLAGFKNSPSIKPFDGIDKAYVLAIGTDKIEKADFDFCNDEKFYLETSEESLVIIAKTVEGMLLGLKAYIRMSEELDQMPQMQMIDWPDIPFRAVHVCMFRPDDGTEKEESSPEYIKKMMKTAAICGYNHIFIEFWGMLPYSLDYAHWPNAYTKEQIEDLVSYAMDKLHIRPLPQQNLTSHAA